MNSEHAVLSPSSSYRWSTCTASIKMCEKLPDIETEYAKAGTKIHEKAYELLKNKDIRNITEVKILQDVHTGDELTESEKITLSYVKTIIKELTPNGYSIFNKLYIEQKVDIFEECYGTCDAFMYSSHTNQLVVVDLKAGKGVKVRVFENTQLLLYAFGAINKLREEGQNIDTDTLKIKLIICQPAMDNTSEYSLSYENLRLRVEYLRSRARIALSGEGAVFAPSKKACQFCRASAICNAKNSEIIMNMENTSIDANAMSESKIRKTLEMKPAFIRFLNDLEKYVINCIKEGVDIEGIEAEPKYSLKWLDEEKARKYLVNMDILTSNNKIKTVLQAQKDILIPDSLYEKVISGYKLIFNNPTED